MTLVICVKSGISTIPTSSNSQQFVHLYIPLMPVLLSHARSNIFILAWNKKSRNETPTNNISHYIYIEEREKNPSVCAPPIAWSRYDKFSQIAFSCKAARTHTRTSTRTFICGNNTIRVYIKYRYTRTHTRKLWVQHSLRCYTQRALDAHPLAAAAD